MRLRKGEARLSEAGGAARRDVHCGFWFCGGRTTRVGLGGYLWTGVGAGVGPGYFTTWTRSSRECGLLSGTELDRRRLKVTEVQCNYPMK